MLPVRILPDPRDRLVELARARSESLAELSRMLRRYSGYLSAYVNEGVPERLTDANRALLAAHFDVPETELGGDDPRWAKLRGHAARTSDRKLRLAA